MSERGRAYRRHHRRRVIAHRLYIYVQCWTTGKLFGPPEQPGRYAKFNLVCSCGMCAYDKATKVVKRKRHALKEELRKELASL